MVAFGSEGHEVFENGEMVYENDRAILAGVAFVGDVEARIDVPACSLLLPPDGGSVDLTESVRCHLGADSAVDATCT